MQGRLFRLVMFRSTRVISAAGLDRKGAIVSLSEVTRVGHFLTTDSHRGIAPAVECAAGRYEHNRTKTRGPFFVARLAVELPCYNDRTLVKSGITGCAQVNCGYGAMVKEARVQLAYALYYLKHRNVLFDVRILAFTICAALFEADLP